MDKSTAARAEARFKQLCCLGLGGEAVMPALLAELRAFVPSLGSTFFFLDGEGSLINIYDENPEIPWVGQLYMQEFYNRPDREMGAGFSDFLRAGRVGVQTAEEVLNVDMRTFRRSDLYNLIYRPLGYGFMIRLVFWDYTRPLGGLMLSRSSGERPFALEELRRLADLESFVAHALTNRSNKIDAPLVDSGKSGVMIVDPAGRVIYSSAEGRRLLFFATHPHIGPDAVDHRQAPLPATLVRLCKNLMRVFSGDPSAAIPAYYHRNIWGGFSFRAHWLEGDDPASGLIGITVSHQEPLPVKLMRRVKELPLSRRQAQVCMLMANGASNENIAEQLGISKYTAIAHGRWIYNKLDVHNRAELVNKLLSA